MPFEKLLTARYTLPANVVTNKAKSRSLCLFFHGSSQGSLLRRNKKSIILRSRQDHPLPSISVTTLPWYQHLFSSNNVNKLPSRQFVRIKKSSTR